ncbi:MAG: secretion protein HlyD family protein [Micavibrio sp.]|nr:secretion protein HlyD family protein [Micavibrio sp.]
MAKAPGSKHSGKSFIIILVILAIVAGAGFHIWSTRDEEKTDDATIEAHIIPIAPKVGGYVVELAVKDNQHVKKGDVILKIDPRDYKVAVSQAQADLAAAEARLVAGKHNHANTSVSAPSNLASAQSQVALAQSEWANATKTMKRLQSLDDTARSRQSLDDAVAAERAAHSRYDDAMAKLKTANTAPDTIAASEAEVTQLAAAVDRAKATLENAQNNLNDTIVYAPEDGRVTRRTVEQGAYLQPGQQLMALVSDDFWVVANYKETQLSEMKPGQPVDIKIDAFHGKTYRGKVDSIQYGTGSRFSMFPAENATGNFVKIVQRVPVKIVFVDKPGAELSIGPGMSVEPIVHVQ